MFTFPVSWLLVACVPGLLMLATFGLGRLERDLSGRPFAITASDESPGPAEVMDMRTLARDGMPEALEYLHLRRERRELEAPPAGGRHAAPGFAPDFYRLDEFVSPAARHTHPRGNPQFKTPGYVNRV